MTENLGSGELATVVAAQSLNAFEALLEELGVPPAERQAMLRRLGKKVRGGIPKEIDTKWILGKLDDKLALTLSYIDEFTLGRANARDLGGLLAVLVDRRQLLRGEPTAIATIEDRRALDDIVPILLAEAQRRGVEITLPSEAYEVLGHEQPTKKRRPPKLMKQEYYD